MIFVLLVLVCVAMNAMEKMDYERSAREKRARYEQFVKAMALLENSEECISDLADRREFPQMRIDTYKIVIQDEEGDYVMLRREDFEGA